MDISVIIPVYNPPHELFDKCIDSLLLQKGNYEFICVNDGSTDLWVEERIKKAICVDSRIRLINKEHSGLCETRNLALKEAKGTYVAFVDADDIVLDGGLQYMFAKTKETNADVSIFGIKGNTNRKPIKRILSASEIDDMVWACLAYRTTEYSKNGLIVDSTWAKLYRKDIIYNNNISFPKDVCKSEDAIFDVWVYKLSNTIIIDNTAVYDYVFNQNSISHAYKYEYAEMIPLYVEAKENLVNRFYYNNIRFEQAVAVRTIVALMDADHCYFSCAKNNKSFWEIAKEFRLLLENPVVARNLKNVDYSLLEKNQLPGYWNKLKLFFYKNNFVEIDMLIYRILHLFKK